MISVTILDCRNMEALWSFVRAPWAPWYRRTRRTRAVLRRQDSGGRAQCLRGRSIFPLRTGCHCFLGPIWGWWSRYNCLHIWAWGFFYTTLFSSKWLRKSWSFHPNSVSLNGFCLIHGQGWDWYPFFGILNITFNYLLEIMSWSWSSFRGQVVKVLPRLRTFTARKATKWDLSSRWDSIGGMMAPSVEVSKISKYGNIWVWVNTYRYIFSGMNIHLPAILGFTRYQGFDP